MKWTLTFNGDYYEDRIDLKQLTHLHEIISALDDCRSEIRSRLKYEDVNPEEEKFLTKLQELLYQVDYDN